MEGPERIDVHAHYYPGSYFRDVVQGARGSRAILHDASGRGMIFGLTDPRSDPEARLADMDRLGIRAQVLSLANPNVYFEEEGKGRDLARTTNNALSELSQNHPGRFYFLASLPFMSPKDALHELGRVSRLPGFVGVYMGTNILGEQIDHQKFWPFFAELERLDRPLFLHPIRPEGGERLKEFALEVIIGFPFETTLAASRLIFSGVLDRYPRLRVILAHFGGYLPYAVARLRHGFMDYDECRVNIKCSPETYLDRFYADTAMAFHGPSLRCAVETLGKKRILLGTDFPFGYTTRGVEMTLETLAGLGLSPEDLAGIESGNLRALLRLPK